MPYVDCLHCSKTFPQPSTRRYCSTLCKNAVDKQSAKLRLAEDRHHQQSRRTPTFDLSDVECLAIEARLAGSEVTVFDSFHGFSVKDAHSEEGSANIDLHESWADKGASLDVWRLRRVDRARFGGIVVTPELAREMTIAKASVSITAYARSLRYGIDGLDSPDFHNKLFGFELDELYELETGDKA